MRVLLADDDAIARLIVSRLITSFGHEVVTAPDGDTAGRLLESEAPEVALIDWEIRGLHAQSLCRRAKAQDNSTPAHVIALVSQKEQRERALDSGCDDFLLKPVDAVELRTRLQVASRLREMIRQVDGTEASDETEASHDRLTGLWNRAAILQFLTGQFARSSRDGISVAVAVADLDNFAEYNERYGRAAGDALLRQIAMRMRNVVRPYDWLGRFEGDSFLIIAPDCTLSNGYAMCERLRSVVAETTAQAGTGRGLTMSFGLSTSAESGVSSEDALLRAAETALYQAKENGRNRVESAKRVSRARAVQSRAPVTNGRELVQ